MRLARSDWAAMAAALLAYGAATYAQRRFLHDDAFISLRYARNLVEHGQLVWNLGEFNEGYTNFLFVLLTGLGLKLGLDPVLAVRWLNLGASIMLIWCVARAALLIAPKRPTERAAAIFAAGAAPPLAIWTLGGLEAPFLAGLIALGCLGLVRAASEDRLAPLGLTAVAFSLAVLTRMDAAAFIGTAGLACLALSWPFGKRMIGAVLVGGIPALVSLAHMAWRHAYYGEFFPLTFYAKTGLGAAQRMEFLWAYLKGSVLWVPLFLIAVLAVPLLLSVHGRRRIGLVIGLPVLAQIGYVIWSGGDHMAAARIVLPVLAPAALVVLSATVLANRKNGGRLATILIALALTPYMTRSVLTIDRAALFGRVVGEHIATTWPKGSLVALHTAGTTPWFAADLNFIDMAGLNDPVIGKRDPVPDVGAIYQFHPGHGKGDGAYVLSRQPDFVIAGGAEGNLVGDHLFVSDVELESLPGFAPCYQLRTETLPFNARDQWAFPGAPDVFVFTYYVRTCE